jgi:Immunity protein 50
MINWYQLAENPQTLSDIYTDVPPLQEVDLIEVILIENGTQMSLKIILSRFPDKPPRKWVESGYNTIQIQIDFLELEEVKISHWSTRNHVNAQIETITGGQIMLNVASLSCNIQAKARSFRVSKVVGYLIRSTSL